MNTDCLNVHGVNLGIVLKSELYPLFQVCMHAGHKRADLSGGLWWCRAFSISKL